MNEEQIVKRIEWLESERREDKQVIASLQKKIAGLEELIEKSNDYIKTLETEVTKTGVRLNKIDAFDDALSKHREEVKKEMTAQEARAKKRETYTREKFDPPIAELNREIASVKAKLDQMPKLRDSIDVVSKSISNYPRQFEELEELIKVERNKFPEIKQSIRMIEDDHKPDKKRIIDLQGEVAALRKRVDENRAQFEISEEAHKKLDNRINELIVAEEKRRENQRQFLDEVSRNQLDAEKLFNEWTKRFAAIEERAETLTAALQTYSEIEASLRKAQGQFDDIIEQITRRIHEITEMQRLGEERFRQEWTTFKSDDQKRWVNYTLTQEEQAKESIRRHERLNERLTTLEEIFQDLHDSVEQHSEQLESVMQGFMGVLREWLSTNERLTDTR